MADTQQGQGDPIQQIVQLVTGLAQTVKQLQADVNQIKGNDQTSADTQANSLPSVEELANSVK
ncbi:hypothetical protein [Streptomyces yunnanensis]|uniref:Uncharacterized protein n=1 Tax=Streptomyces yunnanensis TaxID=156453 RepID=A0A9X8N4W7_9ACTN|nr:hypothetical protein [Streptomyces yunnanensis]SHM99688.1 hypothetical protein SAMN05216268_117100 [Streptomyces yunnanensis]